MPKKSSSFNFMKLPWILLVSIFLLTSLLANISLDGITGQIFMILTVVVLIVEFLKSADINPVLFFVDLCFSIINVILAVIMMCMIYWKLEGEPSFFVWLGCGVIFAEAVVCPFNSFRTALRNIDVAGG